MSAAASESDVKNRPISRVCLFGASGMLGGELASRLRADGVQVTSYTRKPSSRGASHAHWDPAHGVLDRDPLSGADAVVNLAGENLAGGRWSERRKALLRASRVESTALLSRALAELEQPPRVLVNASAVGYYGHTDLAVDESSPRGEGFLASLCEQWEAATAPAAEAGIRVVCLRLGVVLAARGGALAKMLPAFRLGVGGRLGSGEQPFPWVGIADAVAVIRFAMQQPGLRGAVNVVAPEAVTNAQFTDALGHVLSRPTALPVPAFALRAALGELADEALLSGANVRPQVLEREGFRFETPRLSDCLQRLLGVPAQTSS